MNQPRFQIGDWVRVVRLTHGDIVGVIKEVDRTKLVPHYLVAFDTGYEKRFPEFDLAAARERIDSQVS